MLFTQRHSINFIRGPEYVMFSGEQRRGSLYFPASSRAGLLSISTIFNRDGVVGCILVASEFPT